MKKNIERYVVFIVACDTPFGPGLTRDLSNELHTLGLQIDLFEKYRCGYLAIIDGGKVIAEQLSPPGQELKCTGKLKGLDINLVSRGFQSPPIMGLIELNGKNYSSNSRGLNFVVYDLQQSKVVSSITFDTFTVGMPSRDTARIQLTKWHREHPEITLFCLKLPSFPKSNLSQLESHIVRHIGIHPTVDLVYNDPLSPLHQYCDKRSDFAEILHTPSSYFDHNGVRRFEDHQGKYLNIVNGHRVTTNQPQESQRSIYIIGGCRAFGYGVRDEGTIASLLQKICNKNAPLQHFSVENYGYYLCEADYRAGEEMRILQSLQLRPEDIVIANFGFPEDVPLLDLSETSQRPHNYGELFFDTGHLCENGCGVVAEKVFGYLQENQFFIQFKDEKVQFNPMVPSTEESETKNSQLAMYQRELRKFYDENLSVGAIVMNCNPFTLGHRYLIEQACQQCAHLIVFVVEEDKSVFPFKDRFQLVKEGTNDLKNVTVMPSGQFILSSLTFSEYFNKSQLQDRAVDPSMDISLFAKEIAPCLHITKRFVGTEPNDTVTNQYNIEMKKVLPKYGIELVEIDRVLQKNGENVISASSVRKYIQKRDLGAIHEIVPGSTYQYIVQNLDSIIQKIEALES